MSGGWLGKAGYYSRGVGFALVSEDGMWLAVNEFLSRALGVSEQDLVGKSIRNFFVDATTSRDSSLKSDSVARLNEDGSIGVDVEISRSDGTTLLLQAICTEVDPSDGGGWFITFLDATTEADLLRELRDRVSAAEKALAIVAHDIRNPLTTILVSSEVLQSFTGSAAVKKSTRRIQNNANQALQIADDLVDITRWSQGGALDLALEAIDMGKLVTQILEGYAVAHPACRIVCHSQGNLSGTWDAARLNQVFCNLLDNAISHAACASEPIEVRLKGCDRAVTVEIRNGGDTIPASELNRIFQPMFTNRAYSGRNLGLGLFIVKKIIEAHQGAVSVRSSDAEGTIFAVVLPRDHQSLTNDG